MKALDCFSSFIIRGYNMENVFLDGIFVDLDLEV